MKCKLYKFYFYFILILVFFFLFFIRKEREFQEKLKNFQAPPSQQATIIEELHNKIAQFYLEDKAKELKYQEELDKLRKRIKF